ncbi:MAG TPA: FKBP-type peptidyl-prolyl cis-trans isomerase [Caulobacteraceae bacterium]|jgi:FKBP-type peptidyl-prolyl cis-trans isomerase FklB|nr:FKBP-type peptidyl-prolyl cis-trans isomerase [Caulobacteraceae bacterium]
MRTTAFLLSFVSVAALALSAGAQGVKPAATPSASPAAAPLPDALKDPKARASYAIGLNIGAGLKHDGVSVDPAMIAMGIRDVLAGAQPQLTEEQVRQTLTELQVSVQAEHAEKMAKAAETNKAEGEAFLKTNAAKPGVTTLPSGVEYEVLTDGVGPKPKADDMVLCNYRGTLLDGTEFDSSYKRGQPSSFPVGGVIKGWAEILQKMPVGSKWKVYIPAQLAYGERGVPPDIGPNAVLTFEIELLSIQPKT